MKDMKILLLLLPLQLLICGLLQASAASATCRFPAIFNFGDSNSDTGGLAALFGALNPPLNPPYGENFFKKPTGRNSDGRLIIDFIAESLGLPFLSPYLDSVGTNFSHGANFATSASTILRQTLSIFQGGYSPIDLRIQLSEFSRFMVQSGVVYNEQGRVFQELMPKSEYFSRALYTIDIGQNDVTAMFELNTPPDTYIPNALKQFTIVIKSLYDKGGRHFWIHNTGPLGCLPYAVMRRPNTSAALDSVGCSVYFNELAQKFNNKLSKEVASIRQNLPDATIVLVDMYSVKYSFFSQPEKFGFEDPHKTCCGYGGGAYNYDFTVKCGHPVVVNGTERVANSCDDPAKSVVWDGVHYTDAANKVVFDRISGGEFSDPPVALNMACQTMTASV